ncbi:hypothetical protein M3O96_00655 [Aquiflexum sp. TKW24L]|uniref:hypothetical protein n=1 Tax=Aquiflexum sp. TKW24L TaxID=2942212 RepID=UPI0020BF0D1D|nr:hypothetical protein [Aquiflexum sp. TKW24L]MCL6257578.1 hypothetical protein [Aquiflexum sp. TKW24L]
MKIKFTWQYLLCFFCLASLMGITHELVHHVTGYLICGEWGYKTFNSFDLAEGCEEANPNSVWFATIVAPILLNYVPLWIGFFMLRSQKEGNRLFGFSLIFSVIPIMRIVFNLLGANDEPYLIRTLFGDNQLAFWLMNLVTWLLIIPPLVLAYISIKNRFRILVFTGFLLIFPAFVFVFVGIFLENLIVEHHFLSDTLWGMPYLVLLAELLSYIGYYSLRKHLWTV